MSSNHLTLYLRDVFSLAKTLTIKSEYTANKFNESIVYKYGENAVNSNDPKTWKYYQNVSGVYHATDTEMPIVSLDTQQSIIFNKANLALHPATAEGYRYGSRYYKELVARYPQQEILILGILNPADITAAIEAPDYSVLAYPKYLVESNEEDLIPGVNEFCVNFAKRWRVGAFNLTQNLYDASVNNTLYQLLGGVIMDLRDRACNTPQAHSFHVRMYLASHQGLDEFIPLLTQEQIMWLYRNIAYVEMNAGKTHVFDELIQNILTKRGIPLVGYDVVHRNQALFDGAVKPGVGFEQVPLNFNRINTADAIDPSMMQYKLANKATGNPDYDLRHPAELVDIGYSAGNRYNTKVLESSAIEVSEGSSVTTIEQALNLWVYAACTNRFNVYTRINHPLTGVELTMSALDAYYLYLYAFANAHGSGITLVPELYASKAPVWPIPPLAALEGLVVEGKLPADFASGMRSRAITPRNFINLLQFRSGFEQAQIAFEDHHYYAAWPSGFESKASALLLLEALWSEYLFSRPETGTPFSTYLESKDLEMGELNKEQWQALYLEIFTNITGLEMQAAATQSNIQRAMITIMERLSSYTVMYIAPNSASAVRSLNFSSLLVDETPTSAGTYYEVPIFPLDAFKISDPIKLVWDIELNVGIIDGYDVSKFTPQDIMLSAFVEMVSEQSEADFDILIAPTLVYAVNPQGELDINYIPGLQETIDSGIPFDEVPNAINYECTPKIPQPGPVDPNDWITVTILPIVKAFPWRDLYLGDFKPFSVAGRLRYFGDEEEVIVLKGIWLSRGDTDIPVFNFSGGIFKISDMFRYVPWFEPAPLNNWKPTIGNIRLNIFSLPDFVKDVFEMAGLDYRVLQYNMELKRNEEPVFFEMKLDGDSGGVYTWKWTVNQSLMEFAVTKLYEQYKLNAFVDNYHTIRFTLNQYETGLYIGSFQAFPQGVIMPAFSSETGLYSLLPLERLNNNYDIGSFYHYNPITLDFQAAPSAFDKMNPEPAFKLEKLFDKEELPAEQAVVETSTFDLKPRVENAEIEFSSGFMIVQLGDMKDHM